MNKKLKELIKTMSPEEAKTFLAINKICKECDRRGRVSEGTCAKCKREMRESFK